MRKVLKACMLVTFDIVKEYTPVILGILLICLIGLSFAYLFMFQPIGFYMTGHLNFLTATKGMGELAVLAEKTFFVLSCAGWVGVPVYYFVKAVKKKMLALENQG